MSMQGQKEIQSLLRCLITVFSFVCVMFPLSGQWPPKSSKSTHSHPLAPLEGPCAVKITRTRRCRDGWEDAGNLLSTGSSGHVVHVIMSLHLMLLDTKKWKSRNFRTHFGQYPCRRCPAPEVPGQSLHRSGCRCPPCPPRSVGPVRSVRSVRRGERGSGATTVAPAAPQNDVRDCHVSIYFQCISISYPSYPTASIDQTQSSIDTSHGQPLISSSCAICLAAIISFQLSFG